MRAKKIMAAAAAVCLMIFGGQPMYQAWNTMQVQAAQTFVYEEDMWSFASGDLCSGSDTPYLTALLKQTLLKEKTDTETERFQSKLGEVQTDLSYGMSVLALLHDMGIWNVSALDPDAAALGDISAPVNRNALTAWITYYDMLQYSDTITVLDEVGLLTDTTTALTLLEEAAVAAEMGNGLSILRLHETAESHPKTVLVYGIESGSWRKNSVSYDSRILIADPVNAAFSADSCLYYNSGTAAWCIPELEMSDESGAVIGSVIQDIELLNEYGTDPAQLPRLEIQRVFAYPGDTDIPVRMTQEKFPAIVGMSMNIDLSEPAAAVFRPTYESDSYDLGYAVPESLFSAVINEKDWVYVCSLARVNYKAAECTENEPIISFLVTAADRETVIAAAEQYDLPLQTDPEYGEYYAFPVCFNTTDVNNYYLNSVEASEYPLLKNTADQA